MRRISHNKAQLGQLATLILIIAGAIVLYTFVAKFNAKATFEEAINTCRFSVVAQTATEKIPGIFEKKSPFDISCEKRYIRFYNTRVELGLNLNNMRTMNIVANGQKIPKFKTLNEYTVNQVVAEEMRICWFQFVEGKTSVFVNQDSMAGSKDDVCFVCSEINFEDTVKAMEFKGLIAYMNSTTFDDTGVKYYDYLNQESESKYTWEQYNLKYDKFDMINKPFIMDPKKSYLVVFKKDYNVFRDNVYVVQVVTKDTINSFCDIQAT